MIVKGKVDIMAWHGSLGAMISAVCRLLFVFSFKKKDENFEFDVEFLVFASFLSLACWRIVRPFCLLYTINSPSKDSNNPDDLFQSRYTN